MKKLNPTTSFEFLWALAFAAFAAFAGITLATPAKAEVIANWKVLLGSPSTSGLDTDSPVFGDATPGSDEMDSATVASTFGTSASPQSVSLAIGESLAVSATVEFRGGLNNARHYRLGVQSDGGQFLLSDSDNWSGGWTYMVGTDSAAPGELFAARTDGNFMSGAENAVDLDAATDTTGVLSGDSIATYDWWMTITRDSATTVDVAAGIAGGDGALSEISVASDITTAVFTYTAVGIQTTGQNDLDQLVVSNAQFKVIPTGAITYVDATEGAAGNTFATGGSLEDTSWESGLDGSDTVEEQWTKRTLIGGNSDSVFQALHNLGDGDDMPELTTRITGLADGSYAVWAFYWDQIQSSSQNWTLSAGLSSGALGSFSSPGQPVVPGTSVVDVFNAADLEFSSAILVEDMFDGSVFLRNLFGVYLGKATVSGGAGTFDVYADNLAGNGSRNRTWYEGVGYQRLSDPPLADDLRINSFTSLGEGVWEVTLKAASNTAYELRSSTDLNFTPGTLVEGLAQENPGSDPGTISGDSNNVITTDENGNATARMVLTGDTADFLRAQTAP